MCRMFPERLPEKVRREPRLWAEVEMYDALARGMGFGWVVFYDVAWLGKVRQFDAPRDGQTDFIVAHPEKGILLIEVKGGTIRFDGPSRQWISTDREGVDHKTSPFSQVRDSKYALLNKLLEQTALHKYWIELAHAVAFPALPRPEVAVTPDAPPEIIIGRNDMHRLAARIEEILQYSHGASGHTFRHGPLLVKELTRLLLRLQPDASLGIKPAAWLISPRLSFSRIPLACPADRSASRYRASRFQRETPQFTMSQRPNAS